MPEAKTFVLVLTTMSGYSDNITSWGQVQRQGEFDRGFLVGKERERQT